MSAPLNGRLITFARDLQRAAGFPELLDLARAEASAVLGYNHAWLFVAEDDAADEFRLIEASTELREFAWSNHPKLTIAGDLMLEEVVHGELPVVVDDARTDARTNKEIVARLGNRTIVNVPLRLMDKAIGVFGTGTFGEEGVHPPSAEQIDYLVVMGSLLTVAAARLRLNEWQKHSTSEKQHLERRIAQAQRLESIGLLAGGVAHDFNNLLTVILTTTSLAELRDNPSLAADELAAIRDAALRGAQLTKQLLAVSRAQPLSLQSIEINQLLLDMTTMLRRVIPENIELDFIAHARNLQVEGDHSQLDQVFMNLCINARDAMPEGGRLTIETEQVLVNGKFSTTHPWARPGRYVLVTVTDNGCGMPQDVVDHIFDPFFTTKKESGGTGLGLSVVYGVVRQHGGMITCYSETKHGTTFKVYLPLNMRPAVDVGSKLTTPVQGGTESILLAEDDAAICDVAERILRRANYRVKVVRNGDDACAAVAARTFDLLVLDVVMPGMPIREAMARIRALRPQIKILLASGYTADTNVADLVRESRGEFLAKPYDPDALLAAIRRSLKR